MELTKEVLEEQGLGEYLPQLASLVDIDGNPLVIGDSKVTVIDTSPGQEPIEFAREFEFPGDNTQVVAMCSGLDPNDTMVTRFLWRVAILTFIGVLGMAEIGSIVGYYHIKGEDPIAQYEYFARRVIRDYGPYFQPDEGELYKMVPPFGPDN